MKDETPAMTSEGFPKAAVDIWMWMLNLDTQLPISGFPSVSVFVSLFHYFQCFVFCVIT